MMTDREIISQAFEGLDAADDTYERVLARIRGEEEPRRGLLGWAIAIVLAASMTCGGTAIAITNGFFERVFRGGDGSEPQTESFDHTVPGMQFAEVDEATATRVLGDAIIHANLSAKAAGYELTVEDVVMDDQGMGLATFTLFCPNGTGRFVRTDGGDDEADMELGFNGDEIYEQDRPSLAVIGSDWSEGDSEELVRFDSAELHVVGAYESQLVIDRKLTTQDEVIGTIYFCRPLLGRQDDGTLRFLLTIPVREGNGSWDFKTVSTDAFLPSRLAKSRRLVDEEGHLAYVSAIGVRLAAGEDDQVHCEEERNVFAAEEYGLEEDEVVTELHLVPNNPDTFDTEFLDGLTVQFGEEGSGGVALCFSDGETYDVLDRDVLANYYSTVDEWVECRESVIEEKSGDGAEAEQYFGTEEDQDYDPYVTYGRWSQAFVFNRLVDPLTVTSVVVAVPRVDFDEDGYYEELEALWDRYQNDPDAYNERVEELYERYENEASVEEVTMTFVPER